MDREIKKGLKFGLGFSSSVLFVTLIFLGLVYAVGFHSTSDIISGSFIGNYSFMDGNVGIGTNSPTSTLEVNGSLGVNGQIYFSDGTNQSTASKSMIKAWVNFDGTNCPSSSCLIRDSFNVKEVIRNSAGDYTIEFNNSLSNSNYAVSHSASFGFSGDVSYSFTQTLSTKNSTHVRIVARNYDSGSPYDTVQASLVVVGD